MKKLLRIRSLLFSFLIKPYNSTITGEQVFDWNLQQQLRSFLDRRMSLSLFTSVLHKLASRWPLLLYAAIWTTILSLTVAAASFWPELAFVWSISPQSSFSRACAGDAFLRVPLDAPGEILCLPAHFFKRSKIDLIVPPVFAAVVVAGSACVVRAVGLFEHDDSS